MTKIQRLAYESAIRNADLHYKTGLYTSAQYQAVKAAINKEFGVL